MSVGSSRPWDENPVPAPRALCSIFDCLRYEHWGDATTSPRFFAHDGAEPMEKLIDAVRAGEILKLHPKTVKKMAARGEIPALRFGKLWRFQESALDEFVRQRLQSSCHPVPRSEGA